MASSYRQDSQDIESRIFRALAHASLGNDKGTELVGIRHVGND